MKKGILLSVIWILCLKMAFAQFDSIVNQYEQEFDEFQQQIEQEHQKFTDKNDSVFAQFLEDSWEEFEVFYNEKKEPPKPVVQPNVKTGVQPEPVEIQPVPPDSSVPEFSPPEKLKQPEKIEPDKSPESFGGAAINMDFYGAPARIPNPGQLPPVGLINSHLINSYFKVTAGLPVVSQLVNELRQLQEKMQLNDWGYYKLVEQAANSMEISHNQRILFSWVLLLKSGYNVKVGFTDNKVYLMLPTKEEIFLSYYLTVDGSPYYIQTKRDKNNPLPSLTIHKANYPGSRFMSLKMNRVPQLGKALIKRKISFKGDTLFVPTSKSLARFYSDYPLCNLEVFFSTPLSVPAMQSLEKYFNPLFAEKNDRQKVALLLKFVQTVFDYKTDGDQFGHEKYFFPDEVFFYPFSDCEDRSVLFTRLVNHFTHYRCVGLDFPGHVNAAVAFNQEMEGTTIEIDGKKYTVCDPTYENAPVGYLDARYKKFQPGIIIFDN